MQPTEYLSTSFAAMIQPLPLLVFLLAIKQQQLLHPLLPVLNMTEYILATLLEEVVTMLGIMFQLLKNAREGVEIHKAVLGSTTTLTNAAGLRVEKEPLDKEVLTMALSQDLLTAD